jgi:CRP-like cAMP-binding protein
MLGRLRMFRENEPMPGTLFGPGASYALVILGGLVKVTATSPTGYETILAVRGAGDLLGEHGALRELAGSRYRPPRRTRNLQLAGAALTTVEARVFPSDELGSVLVANPAMLTAVALGLWEQLEEAESRIAAAGDADAPRRLAQLLCDLEAYGHPQDYQARGYGPRDYRRPGTVIPVSLTQAEYAAWIGASQETVERALRRWRGRRIISTGYRTIVVHDLASLARIAGIEVRRRAWNWPAPTEANQNGHATLAR